MYLKTLCVTIWILRFAGTIDGRSLRMPVTILSASTL